MKKLYKYLLLTASVCLITSCNRQIYYEPNDVYDDIEQYSTRFNDKNIYYYSARGLVSFNFNTFECSYLYNPKGLNGVSIDEARKINVYLYLELLNRFNVNKAFELYRQNESFLLKKLIVHAYYGSEYNPSYVSKSPSEISKSIIDEKFLIKYFIPKSVLAVHEETLDEAIEILKKRNEIENLEYLKWLENIRGPE